MFGCSESSGSGRPTELGSHRILATRRQQSASKRPLPSPAWWSLACGVTLTVDLERRLYCRDTPTQPAAAAAARHCLKQSPPGGVGRLRLGTGPAHSQSVRRVRATLAAGGRRASESFLPVHGQ
jgi:hypothetical protein